MLNLMKKSILIVLLGQVIYGHKVVYNNNVNKVNDKNVYNEYTIIKPKVSPYIMEKTVYDKIANRNSKCPILDGLTSEHCNDVYDHFNRANKTNIEATVEFGTAKFLEYSNSLMKDATGFVNYSQAKTTEDAPQIMSLNIHQKVAHELNRNSDNFRMFYEITKNQSNAILNFRGMGNDEKYIEQSVYAFNAMNELMQKRFRGENIYITSKSERNRPFNHSYYLRGTTVGTEKDYHGTSFSSPTVMGYATNVAAKFPNLSLHQIKQIILTTATPVNKDGYLDNKFGWGYVNGEKALKGPAQFNAGLLDEEALYAGNADKIYDNKGNTYFYVDTPKNETYIFSNNITSGLTGDSYKGAKTKRTYKTYIHRNKLVSSTFKKALNIDDNYRILEKSNINNIHVTDVIPSEYRMYKDRTEAGLRKAGLGTLILKGEQNYTAPTQVLEGTLILENKTKSTYEILEGATLIIKGNNIHIRELKVAGEVIIDGTNITIDNIIKTPIGKLNIKNTSKNIIIENITVHKLNSKNIKNDVFIIKNVNIKNVEFENITINLNKTFILPSIELRTWVDLDSKLTKLKDLKGVEKFNLLQYNDKTDSFEELALNIDTFAYERYLTLKNKAYYKTSQSRRNVSYYDVIFENGLVINELKEGY